MGIFSFSACFAVVVVIGVAIVAGALGVANIIVGPDAATVGTGETTWSLACFAVVVVVSIGIVAGASGVAYKVVGPDATTIWTSKSAINRWDCWGVKSQMGLFGIFSFKKLNSSQNSSCYVNSQFYFQILIFIIGDNFPRIIFTDTLFGQ